MSSDIDLDDILDGVWKMPNEGSSNLRVDQTEGTNELFNERWIWGEEIYVTIIRKGSNGNDDMSTRMAEMAR